MASSTTTLRPSKTQLRQQAKLLEDFGPVSDHFYLSSFIKQSASLTQTLLEQRPPEEGEEGGDGGEVGWNRPAERLTQLDDSNKSILLDRCRVDELKTVVEPFYSNVNLLLELKQYQHELATPWGSLFGAQLTDSTTTTTTGTSMQDQGLNQVLALTSTSDVIVQDEERHQVVDDVEVEVEEGRVLRSTKQTKSNSIQTNEEPDISVMSFDPNIHPSLQLTLEPETTINEEEENVTSSFLNHESGSSMKPKRIRRKVAPPRFPMSSKPKSLQHLFKQMTDTKLQILSEELYKDSKWYVKTVTKGEVNIIKTAVHSGQPQPVKEKELPVVLTITFTHHTPFESGGSIAPRRQTLEVLSNQTLADIRNNLGCSANWIPREIVPEGQNTTDVEEIECISTAAAANRTPTTGQTESQKQRRGGREDRVGIGAGGVRWCDERWDAGSCFAMEGVLYGDRQDLGVHGKTDYAELMTKLADEATQGSKEKRWQHLTTSGPFSSTLRHHLSSLPKTLDSINNTTRTEDVERSDAEDIEVLPNEQQDQVVAAEETTDWISTLTDWQTMKPRIESKGQQIRLDEIDKIRIGEPYWFIHQGDCEHLWIIEQVRALRSDDPPWFEPQSDTIDTTASTPPIRAWPVTTFLSRIMAAKCRVCDRDPASLVVVGDELCGESPCFVCDKCFDLLHGHESTSDETVKEWWTIPLLTQTGGVTSLTGRSVP